ncbi:DnaJ domain-containing protein [Nannizzia gypsea CBS 118893]|uniref:DnaJ domain-containing protein n=1 Tax=Arthroderma gypseum (strain ATCC MYA-4604 / CBS 118893) TaxID=535722 RepID=E5R3Z9_ARTGP|nr:DnaJ domain-containing protein [Nannizzia gypsea CBS 118893]EFQ98845.1 DnaJ domain-containing protein [Nannizzia gypsea CBS 118893]
MPFCSHNPCLRHSPALLFRRPITRLRPSSNSSSFSSTALRATAQTYYDILGVPVTATTDEIKKKFYVLSLAHHPDRNKEPGAADKFSSISSAYHVLANPKKRARYDRENSIRIPSASGTATRPGTGSFSSASASAGVSQFGSRPASGLSKRRGTFKGPPPSFYAHGGYGTSQRQSHEHQPGPHQQEHPEYHHSDVPHFDARSHRRTQSHEDMRRRARRAKSVEEQKRRVAEGQSLGGGYDGGSMTVRFLVISGILAVAMLSASFARTKVEEPGLRELSARQKESRTK